MCSPLGSEGHRIKVNSHPPCNYINKRKPLILNPVKLRDLNYNVSILYNDTCNGGESSEVEGSKL